MPRTLSPELRDCLERENPYTEYRVEIAQPDVGKVLRRQDEFTQAPTLVSLTPASSLSASARGGLILAPTPAALATFSGVLGSYDLNLGDTPDLRYKGLEWTIDAAFSRATLKSIVAKVQAVAFAGFFFDQSFEVQVYQIVRTPSVKVENVGLPNYQAIAFTEYSFNQLLTPAPTVRVTAAQWGVNATQTLTFDLSNFGLILENLPTKAVTPDQAGILPKYLIVIRLAGTPSLGGTGHYRWLTDTVASHNVANVGRFDRVFWSRSSADAQWAEQVFTDVPNCVINVEAYPASGQGIYLLDLGAAPKAASTGRVEFQRALPPGTSATLELSNAGPGGPWVPVKHGDDLTARTNLAIRANEIDNAAWSKSFTAVTADAVIAPDGTLTADKLTENDGGVLHAHTASQLFAGLPDNTIYTWSRWFKAAERSWALLSYQDKAGVYHPTWFDLTNGAVGVTSAGNNATIVADPRRPGWWRASINVNTATGATTPRMLAYIALANNVAGSGYIGAVGSGIYTWGAQFELGKVATDFIPTAATAVTFGGAQQTYHLRTTLTPDAALHATPEVIAQGVEFRIPQDVSVESILTLPTREISLPWPKASIPEGKIRTMRFGVRDYLDVATVLGSTAAASRLEADIFLASRHPSVTREKWFRLERMMVSNRVPSATSEEFTLLSYASRLKRKIPQKAETINSVHTVVSSTTGQVVVTPVLVGTTVGGNEYDFKNYYMRVRSTSATNMPAGFLATIQGSTDTTKLDFGPALPQALVAGDIIEVHSGIFATQAVSWTDYDPADAWWEVLTNLLAIPPERIGIGSLPRGGRPPKVTDIAPGDPTTQAKRRVTGRIAEETSGDKILDILSAIMGGATVEIDGQICFVQIIPLTDLSGAVTVPLPTPAAVFDNRDFSADPQTPPGLEARATIVAAKYGVPATAASPDAFASQATTAVDTDALLWLQQQDLTEYGTADVPDDIAAWLYNTTDQGLYLASVISAGLVKAASTGLRIWPLSMAEKHPTLVPGDVIVITTDQYTDYDPSSSTPIKGPAAIRGILVRVGNEGRQLSMFVPGLRDNVQLIAGGKAGTLPGIGTGADLFALSNFRVIAETLTTITYGWNTGALVAEVWYALVTFAVPVPADPWAVVGLASSPLATGISSITVNKPTEGSVTFLQVEPRTGFLSAGEVRRAVVNATPSQLPMIELDDSETTTVGTQWWSITERGLAVTSVQVQTQIGAEPITPFGPPTRGPGAASVVRGGILDVGQYEHDVLLDPTRLSWIMPRLTLSGGAAPVVLGPFGFDRDRNPNLLTVSVTGTIVSILADTDTKSIRVFDALGTWEYVLDGLSATIDVSKMGTNGVAGLASTAASTFTIQARSDPTAYVGGGTLIVTQNVVISGSGAAPPAATWDSPGLTAQAPAIGSGTMTIHLKATSAPVGWTVKLWAGPNNNPSVDITATVTPALSAPPIVDTTYSYPTGLVAVANPPRAAVIFAVRADLVNNLGVVVDSRLVHPSWYKAP